MTGRRSDWKRVFIVPSKGDFDVNGDSQRMRTKNPKKPSLRRARSAEGRTSAKIQGGVRARFELEKARRGPKGRTDEEG